MPRPDAPAPQYTVTSVDGRYPAGVRFDPTSLVASVDAESDNALILRLDDARRPEFWLQVTIRRTDTREQLRQLTAKDAPRADD